MIGYWSVRRQVLVDVDVRGTAVVDAKLRRRRPSEVRHHFRSCLRGLTGDGVNGSVKSFESRQ